MPEQKGKDAKGATNKTNNPQAKNQGGQQTGGAGKKPDQKKDR